MMYRDVEAEKAEAEAKAAAAAEAEAKAAEKAAEDAELEKKDRRSGSPSRARHQIIFVFSQVLTPGNRRVFLMLLQWLNE